ncbi:MAG: nicotinate-nucleotide adenylyltransferase [Acetobacterales bacterium]
MPAPTRYGDGRRTRIGLLGGSFNPAHDGHRHISLVCLKALGLDEVWWLVSPQNPLKQRRGMAPLPDRLAGAKAVAAHPRLHATDIEQALGTRYTIDTLRALKRRFPRAHFVWIMGADNAVQVSRWRHWTRMFHTVPVAILPRRPYFFQAMMGKAATRFRRARLSAKAARRLPPRTPPAWVALCGPLHPASATEIRARHGSSGDRQLQFRREESR